MNLYFKDSVANLNPHIFAYLFIFTTLPVHIYYSCLNVDPFYFFHCEVMLAIIECSSYTNQ